MYEIKDGDTIYDLAIARGLTTESILDLNPGIVPTNLQIGQIIIIPCVPPPPAPESVDCTVGCNPYCSSYVSAPRSGTCEEVAAAMGQTPDVFSSLNPDLRCSSNPVPIEAGRTQLCARGTLIPVTQDMSDPRNPNRYISTHPMFGM